MKTICNCENTTGDLFLRRFCCCRLCLYQPQEFLRVNLVEESPTLLSFQHQQVFDSLVRE